MKNYELMIERQQPPCGGKQPKLYDFQNVETDAPVAYVRAHEQDLSDDLEMEIDRSTDSVVCVQFTRGIQPVKYEFTEHCRQLNGRGEKAAKMNQEIC